MQSHSFEACRVNHANDRRSYMPLKVMTTDASMSISGDEASRAAKGWAGTAGSSMEHTDGRRLGKLRIRFEKRFDIHEALLKLAAAIICARFVDRWC